MKKGKLNYKELEKTIDPVKEELTQFISIEEIKKQIEKYIDRQFNYNMTILDTIHFNTVTEKLYNDTYKLFEVYIDIFADTKKHYSKKTGKCKYNEYIPHNFRVQVYYDNKDMLFYLYDDKIIRRSHILEVEE